MKEKMKASEYLGAAHSGPPRRWYCTFIRVTTTLVLHTQGRGGVVLSSLLLLLLRPKKVVASEESVPSPLLGIDGFFVSGVKFI